MQRRQSAKIESLKVEAHPRGHVALCNGRVDIIPAKAVPAIHETKHNAMTMASQVEKLSRMAYQEKQRKLVAFRRQVQKRVTSREREKELEMQLQSGNAVTAEHGLIQRGVFMEPQGRGPVQHQQQPPDVEDACITASSGRSSIHQMAQDLQLARKKLAAKKKPSANMSELPGGVWHNDTSSDNDSSLASTASSQPSAGDDDSVVAQSTSMTDPSTSSNKASSVHKVSVPVAHTVPSRTTALNTYSSLRKVEEEKKKHAANQYLLQRQLFSDMERQQVRETKRRAEHNKKVRELRELKELERQRIEQAEADKIGHQDSPSSEEELQEERIERWTALLAIEEHKRRIQKAKETDRYIQALHQQLKERVEQKCCSVPPLCSCGPTIWDTNPNTCANNCVFYKNPKGYVKALTSVLIHLDTASTRHKTK